MSGMKQVRIQSPLNLEYLLLNEMTSGRNTDVVFLCSGGKKVGFVKSLLCSSFPLFHQILPSCESEKFLPKDSQIFVSMDEVESELLEEYLITSLSGSDTGVVDLRFSEIDSMLKHRPLSDRKEKVGNITNLISDIFDIDSLVNEILEDCIRVKKSETLDSEIIEEIDFDDEKEEEVEQTKKLTMSCIKSKSPAQFYRSFTSEPEEDTPDLDFDDLEVKMENSITGVDDVVDEITDEFCDSASSMFQQPIVQVKMDVIKEVLADPIEEDSFTPSQRASVIKLNRSIITAEASTNTEEPQLPSNNDPENVPIFNVATPVPEPPKENVNEPNSSPDFESHAKEGKAPVKESTVDVKEKKKRKRCQLTLVKTKEQIEWENFPEKLGLMRKPNPGKENKSKIPKIVKATKSPKAEISSVPGNSDLESVRVPLVESPSAVLATPLAKPLTEPMEDQLKELHVNNEEGKSNTTNQAGLKQCTTDEPSLLDSIDYLMGDVDGKVDDNPNAMMDEEKVDDKVAEREANVGEVGGDVPETTNNYHQSDMTDEEITFNPTRKVVPGPAIIDEDTVPDPGLAFAQAPQGAAVGPQMSTYEPMLPSREWDYSDTEIDEMFQTCLDEELGNRTDYQDASQESFFKESKPEGHEETVMDQDVAEKTLAEDADNSLKSDVTLGDSYEDHDQYDYEDDEDYDEEITKLETQIDVMKQKAEETLTVPPVAQSEKPKKSKKRRAEDELNEGDSKKPKSEVSEVSGEFQCYFCEKVFKRVDDLLQHLSQSHFGKELFAKYPIGVDETCPVCVIEDTKRKYVMKDVRNKGPYFYHIGKVHKRVLECLEPHHQADLIKKLNVEPSSLTFLTIPADDPSASVSLEEASMKADVEMPLPPTEMSDVVINKEAIDTEAPTESKETLNIDNGKKKRGRRSRQNKTETDENMDVVPESSEVDKTTPSDALINKEVLNTEASTRENNETNIENGKKKRGRRSRLNKTEPDINIPESSKVENAIIPPESEGCESAPAQTVKIIVNPPSEPLTMEGTQEPVKKGRRGRKPKAQNPEMLDGQEPEASLNASNHSDTDTSLSGAELDKSDNSQSSSKSPRPENLNVSKSLGRSKGEGITLACSLCDKPESKWTKGKLFEHLPTHFNKQINEKYNSSYVEDGQCVLCVREEKPQPFPCQDIQKKRYNFNRHLSSVHKVALEFLIHEDKNREMIEFLGETFSPVSQEHTGDAVAMVKENTELTKTSEAVENVVKTSAENLEDQGKQAAKKPTKIPRKRTEKSENPKLKSNEATDKPVSVNDNKALGDDPSLKDLNLGSTIQVTKRPKQSSVPVAKPIQKPNIAPAEASVVPPQDLPEPLSRLSSMLTIEKKPSKVVSAMKNPPAPAPKSFQCGECPATLESKLGLAKHMKSHLKK